MKKSAKYNLDDMVQCEYCHSYFRYGDNPSNNKSGHNFCCKSHRISYVVSFSKGKTKIAKCHICGKDTIANIHTCENKIFCEECRELSYRTRHGLKPKEDVENNLHKLQRKCIICGKTVNKHKVCCSVKCANEKKYKEYIERWKAGKASGMSGKGGISAYIRRYMFIKYGDRCAICGWSKVNKYSGKIPLQIDHIDGNYRNNKEGNLILLCPNCHSLTPTYMGLNRGNGRKTRYK